MESCPGDFPDFGKNVNPLPMAATVETFDKKCKIKYRGNFLHKSKKQYPENLYKKCKKNGKENFCKNDNNLC